MSLPEFPPFDVTDMSNAGPRWTKWINRFEIMISAMNIKSNTEEQIARKRSLLLHYIGPDAYDIYETLEDER